MTTIALSDCSTFGASCVLYEPLTVTAGPGTYRFSGQGYW